MDLIKKLGGYEKAKWWEYHLIQAEKKGIHHNGVNSALLFTLRELQELLLDYRRANNIFEIGDKVVLVDLRCSNDIWCVSESSTSDYVGVIKEGMLGFSVMHKSMTRHATDAEIAAGHRL